MRILASRFSAGKHPSRTDVPVRCTTRERKEKMTAQTLTSEMKTPKVVSPKEWEAARQKLLVKEKELTHARDALAAHRRRMPWLALEKRYTFDGPDGKASLVDLFDGRRQLIIYHAFIRDGDRVFRTYFINNRGDEAIGSIWSYLDMAALGRQEEWEDSPEGYPQTPPYEWWKWHDEYSDAPPSEGWSAAVERGIQAGQGTRRRRS